MYMCMHDDIHVHAWWCTCACMMMHMCMHDDIHVHARIPVCKSRKATPGDSSTFLLLEGLKGGGALSVAANQITHFWPNSMQIWELIKPSVLNSSFRKSENHWIGSLQTQVTCMTVWIHHYNSVYVVVVQYFSSGWDLKEESSMRIQDPVDVVCLSEKCGYTYVPCILHKTRGFLML